MSVISAKLVLTGSSDEKPYPSLGLEIISHVDALEGSDTSRASPRYALPLFAFADRPDIHEKEGATLRRLRKITFTLPSDVIEKLSRPPFVQARWTDC